MTDRDTEGEKMKDRLSQRFGDDEDDVDDSAETAPSAESAQTAQPSKTSQTSQTAKTDMPAETTDADASVPIDEETTIKDLPSILMYLPEDLHEAVDLRFQEVKLAYQREHGEAIEKNRHFYPALVKAGLEGNTVEDVLEDLDSTEE